MFKRINIILLLLLNILSIGRVNATDSGSGRVHISGMIIDTACAIDVNSIDQTIDMGVVPISLIIRDGQGKTKDFSINLVKCVLDKSEKNLSIKRNFQITFDGYNDDNLFGVDGEAKGVAMKISDSEGHIAEPGTALPAGNIDTTDMSLKYTLQLVSNNKKLQAGDYTSTIKFKMDYY